MDTPPIDWIVLAVYAASVIMAALMIWGIVAFFLFVV